MVRPRTQPSQLVAQANPEVEFPLLGQVRMMLKRSRQRRVPRPIGEKSHSGFMRECLGPQVDGTTLTASPIGDHHPHDVPLHP
jgi:hypothetical protein